MGLDWNPWGSASAYWRIGVWGSKTAFRHGYNDKEVSTELMMLCKRRHTDTFPVADPFSTQPSGPRPVGCFSVRRLPDSTVMIQIAALVRRSGDRSWCPRKHRRDAYATLKLGDVPGARTVPSLKYHRRPACSLFFVGFK